MATNYFPRVTARFILRILSAGYLLHTVLLQPIFQ
jgi:hypothetical protein